MGYIGKTDLEHEVFVKFIASLEEPGEALTRTGQVYGQEAAMIEQLRGLGERNTQRVAEIDRAYSDAGPKQRAGLLTERQALAAELAMLPAQTYEHRIKLGMACLDWLREIHDTADRVVLSSDERTAEPRKALDDLNVRLWKDEADPRCRLEGNTKTVLREKHKALVEDVIPHQQRRAQAVLVRQVALLRARSHYGETCNLLSRSSWRAAVERTVKRISEAGGGGR